MQGLAISFRVDRNSLDAHLFAGPYDPARYLAAIGY
jgi:hypothetical protein